MKQTDLIYTRRRLEIQIRVGGYLWVVYPLVFLSSIFPLLKSSFYLFLSFFYYILLHLLLYSLVLQIYLKTSVLFSLPIVSLLFLFYYLSFSYISTLIFSISFFGLDLVKKNNVMLYVTVIVIISYNIYIDYVLEIYRVDSFVLEILLNSFFLNQQFITQDMRVDHSNYFVTILSRTKKKEKKKERKEKEK